MNVPWPETVVQYQSLHSEEACDMAIGLCVCGHYHTLEYWMDKAGKEPSVTQRLWFDRLVRAVEDTVIKQGGLL